MDRSERYSERLVRERDGSFDRRVEAAYGYNCAFTQVGFGLTDAAHIMPVTDGQSNDETSNGILLSATYHRAYDRGVITFDVSGTLFIDADRLERELEAGLSGDLRAFVNPLRSQIHLPQAVEDRPHPTYVERANQYRGWSHRHAVPVHTIRERLGLA